MADVYAVKSGNWSDTTLWNTGSLPAVIDDVYSNNFIVVVDGNYRVNQVSNGAATGILSGGHFRMNNATSLSAFVLGVMDNVACVQFLSASPNTCTIVGDLCASNITILRPGPCLLNNSTGTMTVRGNCLGFLNNGGTTTTFPHSIIRNNSSGILNLFGRYVTGSSNAFCIYGGNVNLSGSVIAINGSGVAGFTTANLSGTFISQSSNCIEVGLNCTANVYGTLITGGGHVVANTSSQGFVNIYGIGYGGPSTGGNIVRSDSGVLNIVGTIFGGTGTNAYGIRNTSTGIVRLTGTVIGGTAAGGGSHGIYNEGFGGAAGTVTIVGSAIGSDVNGTSYGVANNSIGTVTISGAAIGGLASGAYGAFNNSTGTLRVKRAIGNSWGLGYTTSQGPAPGVFSNAQGSRTFVEELELGVRGQWPTGGVIFFTPNSKATSIFKTDTFQNYTLIQSNSADNLLPPVSSVRQGEVYNLGSNTGTCIIPPVSSVAVSVLVDNLPGTAVLTPQTTWNYPTTASDINSMGGRLRNALNTDSAEKLINSFSS